MKLKALLVAALGLGAIATTAAFSQGDAHAEAMRLAQPGPEHKVLADLAGTWNVETKIWSQPGGRPMVLKGTLTSELILGGRYLRSHSKSGPFESLVIHGFDRRHGKFTTVGFDTMGTYYVTANGTYDAATKTLTERGTDAGPIATQEYEYVTRFSGKDRYVTEIFFTNPAMTHGKKRFKVVISVGDRRLNYPHCLLALPKD